MSRRVRLCSMEILKQNLSVLWLTSLRSATQRRENMWNKWTENTVSFLWIWHLTYTLLSLALTHTWLYSLVKECMSSRKHCVKKGKENSIKTVIRGYWVKHCRISGWLTLPASSLCLSVVISEQEAASGSTSVGCGVSLKSSAKKDSWASCPISSVDSSFSLNRR